jgi:hypothetical protein
VEVIDGKVVVCRDAAKSKCTRHQCKYYHIPTVGNGPLAGIHPLLQSAAL